MEIINSRSFSASVEDEAEGWVRILDTHIKVSTKGYLIESKLCEIDLIALGVQWGTDITYRGLKQMFVGMILKVFW